MKSFLFNLFVMLTIAMQSMPAAKAAMVTYAYEGVVDQADSLNIDVAPFEAFFGETMRLGIVK